MGTVDSQRELREERARRALHAALPGEALVDEVSRGIYATDASLYEFPAIAVVTPRGREDLQTVFRIATECGVPVMPRGGGTSLAGQTANRAIVVDVSKHMNKLLELNAEEKWARVQPGLIRDTLCVEAARYGLEYAPETSTSNRAALGGMIGNNSSGMHSVRYGRTIDHLIGAKIMLANGEVVDCIDRTPEQARRLAGEDCPEGHLWRDLIPILDKNRAFVEERFPKVMRRVGGYSLDEFPQQGPWNLAKLVCGSEGTLATVLEATVKLIEPPSHVGMLAVHFDDLIHSFRSVPLMLTFNPLSVELIDSAMVKLARVNPGTKHMCHFIEGDPKAILVVELTGESEEEVTTKLEELERTLRDKNFGYAHPHIRDPKKQKECVELRKLALGVLLSVRGDTKPIPFIEDACVPTDVLADYLDRVSKVIESEGLPYIMFGHASVGVVHVRPMVNQKDAEHVAKIERISRQVVDLVKEYGGSWSGEHGDGIARGAMNERFWGTEMIQVFRDVKHVFDPKGLMNPGRVFDAPPMNENLRYGGSYKTDYPTTFFRFEDFQGFGRAVEMCNGVGACRKIGSGTMCPSYMATLDEEATTRGRANALRLAISGKFPKDGLTSERVHEVLDLCLECKACKTECPSNVDMSRMKSEHLAHYHEARGGPTIRDRNFADAPVTGRLMSGPLAPIANSVMGIAPIRRLMLGALGIAPERNVPAYATRKLESWFAGHRASGDGARGEVVLFGDCWANYNETMPGLYAVRVLEHLGYKVTLVANACCQRTRISKGLLEKAKYHGGETVERLRPFAEKGIPIVGIEPSCVSSLTDDLPDLVTNKTDACKVGEHALPIEEFLAREMDEAGLEIPPQAAPPPAYLVHGHCHQKALFSTAHAKKLLAAATGNKTPRIDEVDSGCCGMAGSFGYEIEHYELSRKIAESRLLPAINEADRKTVLIANGFSCRHQIKDFGNRHAMHVIEAFGRALFGEWP